MFLFSTFVFYTFWFSQLYKPSSRIGRTCDCNTGWEGVGFVESPCIDVDECTVDEDHELFHACDPECTSCHDIDGSYECHCKPGFESTDGSTDTDRRICTDIINCGFDDSCEDARTTCIDTPGCADPNKCDHDCFND